MATAECEYSRTEDDGLDRRRVPEVPKDTPILIEDDATAEHLAELGIEPSAASVLPRNFGAAKSSADFVFEQMTSTIRTLGRQVGLTIEVPGSSAYRSIHEKDYEVIAPVLQFSHAFLIEGGAALTVTFLEHFARHVASRWGVKRTRERDAIFEVVITRGKRAKRLTYRGPVHGLSSIVEAARAAFGENDDDR
jgi:hypothetical protein